MSEAPPEERAYHHHAHLLSRKHTLEQEILSEKLAFEYWSSLKLSTGEAQRQRDVGISKARLHIRQARENLRLVKSELKSIESQKAKKVDRRQSRWELVKPLLAAKGITKHRWAVLAGVSPSTVQNYLDGTATYQDKLEKLAQIIDIDVDSLRI